MIFDSSGNEFRATRNLLRVHHVGIYTFVRYYLKYVEPS